MKLTPLDIEQQTFRQVFRGLDPEEVQRFLEQVATQVEELIRDQTELRDTNRRLEQQLAEFRAHEGELRAALVSAGRMGDEIKDSARKEAELLRAEAEVQAEKIVAGARDQVVRLSEQTRDLRLQKARLLGELRSVVDAHRRLLDTHEAIDQEEAERRAEAQQQEKPRSGIADVLGGLERSEADFDPAFEPSFEREEGDGARGRRESRAPGSRRPVRERRDSVLPGRGRVEGLSPGRNGIRQTRDGKNPSNGSRRGLP